MSFESWKEKYYPVDAMDMKGKPKEELIQHSLQKWLGLRKEILKEHGLAYSYGDVTEFPHDATSPGLSIGSESCALCQEFFNELADYSDRCTT